jgi:hypothetical protein
MKIPKLVAVALASVAGTAVFILCCGGGPKSASAQSCPAWEVSMLSFTGAPAAGSCTTYPSYPSTCRTADGWEPFASDGSVVLLRRCAQ